jgi:hypothetical protein
LPDGNLYALPPKETFRDDQMLEEDDRRGPRSTTHSATGRQKAALQRFPLSTPSTSLIDLSHIRSRFGLPTKRPKPLAKKRGQWLTMGTDMTMIEKVARAICKTHGAFDPDALTAGVAAWKYYIPEARAAIAAMREPTDEIRRAGDQTISPEAYQAMIDAALNENVEQA